MEDIELVIKIPESIFNTIQADEVISREQLMVLQMHILNGTPLPKGHGRLIDADAYYTDIKSHYFDDATVIRCTEIGLNNTPTIIEADTESEEDDSDNLDSMLEHLWNDTESEVDKS